MELSRDEKKYRSIHFEKISIFYIFFAFRIIFFIYFKDKNNILIIIFNFINVVILNKKQLIQFG